MSIRLRRLSRDYEKVVADLSGNEFVDVKAVAGEPPNSYRITYFVNGLEWDDTRGDTKPRTEHVVDIYLPLGYPKKHPNCTMRTPIWHPNIGDYICIGDFWSAGVALVDIIAHIGDMIQYKNYNLKSPVNKAAAIWAQTRTASFPVGTREILLPDDNENGDKAIVAVKRAFDEIEIDLGPIRERP